MQIGRLFVCSFLAVSLVLPAASQQPTPQALQLLQQALKALGITSPVTDITLSGTAHYVAGSDDETGTATLKALGTGASRVDLNLSSGPRSEIINISSTKPTGSWSGPDGVAHKVADHNALLADPTWFFPVFPISRGLAAGITTTYVGLETHNGQSVQHLSVIQQAAGPAQSVPLIQHLSQIELYLDSATFLPVALDFNVHPDDNAALDIPIDVRFSDYRNVSGVQVPFHVQKFLNNSPVLDLQFQTVTLNSGLSASDFPIQ